MQTIPEAVFDLIDREFNGKSWNGPSFMATLDKLSPTEAASRATWEGYSAWEIANHCATCKLIMLTDLGQTLPEWPYDADKQFPAPTDVTSAAWERDKNLYSLIHARCLATLRALSPEQVAQPMPTWKAPWLEIIVWLTTHDAFHGAQLRSMGLPTLKAKKHE